MNYWIWLSVTIFGLSALPAARLELANGDQLKGKLVGIESRGELALDASPPIGDQDRVAWEADLLSEQASFDWGQVKRLVFDPPAEETLEVNSLVYLGNGDVYEGRLLGLNEGGVKLQTGYAGEIEIKRSFVTQLRFPVNSEFTYFGPNRLDEWINHGESGDWKLEDGALVTETSEVIGLEKQGLDLVHYRFRANWETQANFRFCFFADQAAQDMSTCFQLNVAGGRMDFEVLRNGRRLNRPVRFNRMNAVPEFNESGGGEFHIFASRERGSVEVWFEGRRVETWQNNVPADGLELGGSILFHNLATKRVAFSQIEMAPWDGVPVEEEDFKAYSADLPSVDGDRLILLNGDNVEGEIGPLLEGSLGLKTAGLDMKLPIERVRVLRLFNPTYVKYQKVPSPRLYNRDVRASLHSGRGITFRLKGMEDGRLLGYSEAVGEFRVDPRHLAEMAFGLYP